VSLPAYRRAARSLPCPKCGAEVDRPCRTKSGHTTYEHAERSRLTLRSQNIGYEEGLRDALSMLDWQAEKPGDDPVGRIRDSFEKQLAMIVRVNRRESGGAS
jgi:hypothetical protein